MTQPRICNTAGVSEPASNYGRRLRAAREAAGLTQHELSTRSGVSIETVRKHEYRDDPPRDLRNTQALEHALGVRLVADPDVDDVEVIGRGFSVEALSKADAQTLTRALSAKLAAEAAGRGEAVALVWKLCGGEGSEWERRRWAKQVETALTGSPKRRHAPSGGTETAAGAAPTVTEDDPTGPFGAGFDYVRPEASPSSVDGEKSGDDSAQA